MCAAPVIAALLLAVFASPAAAAWRPPVAGGLTRPFAVAANPFAGGQHRGIDLRAAPGTPVVAPCAGRVVVASRVGTSGGVVALRCGRWRVTHLPLATITVRAGTSVARGARLGVVAAAGHAGASGARLAADTDRAHVGTSGARLAADTDGAHVGTSGAAASAHAGLHLGVRREGERFGYVDPLRFLAPAPSLPLAPLGRAPRGRRDLPPSRPRPRRAAPTTAPVLASLVAPLAASLDVAAHSDPGRLAPWPAWLGLALMLAGAGVRWRRASRTRTRRQVRATARLNE
jgi:hypothetical protein